MQLEAVSDTDIVEFQVALRNEDGLGTLEVVQEQLCEFSALHHRMPLLGLSCVKFNAVGCTHVVFRYTPLHR